MTILSICTAAATRIGIRPISALDADEPGVQATIEAYHSISRFALDLTAWSFATFPMLLDRLAYPPRDSGWVCAHQLPSDRIGLPTRLLRDKTADDGGNVIRLFAYSGDMVLSDETLIYAIVKRQVDPTFWSGAFAEAVTVAVAAALALALCADKALHQQLNGVAYGTPSEQFRGGLMGQALRGDGVNSPPRRIDRSGGPLVLSRWRP